MLPFSLVSGCFFFSLHCLPNAAVFPFQFRFFFLLLLSFILFSLASLKSFTDSAGFSSNYGIGSRCGHKNSMNYLKSTNEVIFNETCVSAIIICLSLSFPKHFTIAWLIAVISVGHQFFATFKKVCISVSSIIFNISVSSFFFHCFSCCWLLFCSTVFYIRF